MDHSLSAAPTEYDDHARPGSFRRIRWRWSRKSRWRTRKRGPAARC